MNAMKRILRWVIVLAALVLLCGVLPRIFPTGLPPVSVEAEPVLCIGGDLEHGCEGGIPIFNSMVLTVIVDLLLIGVFLIISRKVRWVPSGLQSFFEAMIEVLYSQCEQVAGKNAKRIFPIGATIFLFVFFANYTELIHGVESIGYVRHPEHGPGYELDPRTPPGSPIVFIEPRCAVITTDEYERLKDAAKEARGQASCTDPIEVPEGEHVENPCWVIVPYLRTPTTDINVTLALALVAFTATQVWGIRNHMPHGRTGVGAVLIGIRRYLGKFFPTSGFQREGVGKIFGAIDLFAGLLELLGEFIRIVSFTFRMFCNIFAGTVLIFVLMSLVAYLLPVAPLLLETFVGLIQAYVFMMLSWVFMSAAAQVHGSHEDSAH